MFRLLSAVSLCLALLAVPAILHSQKAADKPPATPQKAPQKQPEGAPTFTGGTTEVIVPVTVTDDKGRFISNLDAKDFRVTDEGKPQRFTFFSHEQKQPIVVGFLVDLSNHSRIHWKTYQDAILEL